MWPPYSKCRIPDLTSLPDNLPLFRHRTGMTAAILTRSYQDIGARLVMNALPREFIGELGRNVQPNPAASASQRIIV